MAGWEKHYPGMIEWLDPDTHGGIKSVNAANMEIETDLDTFKADAASIVPAQRAGSIAMAAGVNDGDWCPINPANMTAKADENIYVLGDASMASSMPKSGFSANSQAKVAANHIRGALTGSRVYEPRLPIPAGHLLGLMTASRSVQTTRLAPRRLMLPTSLSRRVMKLQTSARQHMKSRLAGTKALPPTCSPKPRVFRKVERRPAHGPPFYMKASTNKNGGSRCHSSAKAGGVPQLIPSTITDWSPDGVTTPLPVI